LSAASTSRAIITVMLEGRVVGLPDGENTIGRGLDCLVQVHCPLASRKHARIVVDKDQATIEDGPSMHGTFVNERRITSATRLRTGDIIRVGSVDLTLKVVRPDAPTDRPTSPQ
jgi:pSer/pThr/pTyr-binding forkhead associated (FHA) protein